MDKIDYTVSKTNLYEQIAETLEQAIVGAEIKAEKLPSEQELAKRFKVSRTVIREALKVLKERGLIRSRNGEGSYISKPNIDTISSAINRIVQMDNISNDHLHDMRLILETAGAGLAALHAGPEDIAHLQYTVDQMSVQPLSTEQRLRFDSEFHITIARASGNKLLEMFVEVMTLLLGDYMIKGFPGPASMRQVINHHEKIFEAIKNGNPEDAEEAIRCHLAAALENIKKYEKKDRKGSEKNKSLLAERRL
ncbi:MAG: FadR family transcriptional regulator [Treponema sp.]|jgi:GntR family transcriptional repressor for pyruvate dehydrogenase complex|nr:FadR family transcriptional regulator [Treponema sp.]